MKTSCPKCRFSFTIEDSAVGLRCVCPQCNSGFFASNSNDEWVGPWGWFWLVAAAVVLFAFFWIEWSGHQAMIDRIVERQSR
jgi:hypothetical protein